MNNTAKRIRTIGCICLGIALLLWAGTIAIDPSPANAPAPFAEQAEGKAASAQTHAAIGSSTIFQSPSEDQTTWQANATTQHVTLANPAGNAVEMAPHIHVDLDGSGSFEDGECVFNPIVRDEAGNVVDWGCFIAPGKQIDSITLSRTIPEGTYAARLSFTALDVRTHGETNPMSFEFTLHAQ